MRVCDINTIEEQAFEEDYYCTYHLNEKFNFREFIKAQFDRVKKNHTSEVNNDRT